MVVLRLLALRLLVKIAQDIKKSGMIASAIKQILNTGFVVDGGVKTTGT
jgi:predicted sugar kinase